MSVMTSTAVVDRCHQFSPSLPGASTPAVRPAVREALPGPHQISAVVQEMVGYGLLMIAVRMRSEREGSLAVILPLVACYLSTVSRFGSLVWDGLGRGAPSVDVCSACQVSICGA